MTHNIGKADELFVGDYIFETPIMLSVKLKISITPIGEGFHRRLVLSEFGSDRFIKGAGEMVGERLNMLGDGFISSVLGEDFAKGLVDFV